MSTPNYVVTTISSLIAAGIGAYLGAYLKQKGQNLATREDVSAITQTQEEIKGAIADQSWTRQKQWETKKEILFELTRTVGQLQWSLGKVKTNRRELASANADTQQFWYDRVAEYCDSFADATLAWDCAKTLASLSCNLETCSAIDGFTEFLVALSQEVHRGSVDDLDKKFPPSNLRAHIETVLAALRLELK